MFYLAYPAEVNPLAFHLPGRTSTDAKQTTVGAAEPDGLQAVSGSLGYEIDIDRSPQRPFDDIQVEVGRHSSSLYDAGLVAEAMRQGGGLLTATVNQDDGRRLVEMADLLPERFQRIRRV